MLWLVPVKVQMVYLSYPAKIMYIITIELPKQSPKLLQTVRDPNSFSEEKKSLPRKTRAKAKKKIL